ncbi:MAG TPA: glycosyltransferase family 4 protein [Conexibacter sp.]|nr:glycosyltransferase family 4 protein [Conexibacter sp.]
MRIAYLVGRYPAVSHTFILREVEELRRLGVDVRTISIHATAEAKLLSDADRREHASTFAVLPTSALRLLAAHLLALLTGPAAYLSTLALALRTSPPGLRNRLWRLFYFGEAMIVRRHCRAIEATHLHAQFADTATDVAMLVAHYERARGRDFTWSLAVHGPVEFYNVEQYALREKLARARFAVAISDFGRSQLMTLAERERWDDIHVVHCGVDPSVYVPPEPPRVERDEAVILTVGRLVAKKGLPILLEALRDLRERGLAVRLVVVGDGPSRTDFEAAARRLGVADHVEFAGSVGQDEIRERYAAADVFCLASFAEGIPVVLMEAMAMELPVVSTTVMGIPELISDGIHGRLVPPGRADRLADALAELIADPQRRAAMGRAGREQVTAEFDVRESARHLQRAFVREPRSA